MDSALNFPHDSTRLWRQVHVCKITSSDGPAYAFWSWPLEWSKLSRQANESSCPACSGLSGPARCHGKGDSEHSRDLTSRLRQPARGRAPDHQSTSTSSRLNERPTWVGSGTGKCRYLTEPWRCGAPLFRSPRPVATSMNLVAQNSIEAPHSLPEKSNQHVVLNI